MSVTRKPEIVKKRLRFSSYDRTIRDVNDRFSLFFCLLLYNLIDNTWEMLTACPFSIGLTMTSPHQFIALH